MLSTFFDSLICHLVADDAEWKCNRLCIVFSDESSSVFPLPIHRQLHAMQNHPNGSLTLMWALTAFATLG